MPSNPTAPFELSPEGRARGHVLLVHGFTGSPWEVRPLAEALAARGYSVSVPRLPGHGGAPEAMFFVTHHDWLKCAREALAALPKDGPVFLAGLSMGALLSVVLAAESPERIRALALLAPAWKLAPPSARVLHRLRHFRLRSLRGLWVDKDSTDLSDEKQAAAAPLLPRYPVARILDLFQVQDLARAGYPKVKAPMLVVAARHDHVVPLSCVQAMHESDVRAKVVVLERGFHIIPRDVERARAATEICQFFDTHGAAAP